MAASGEGGKDVGPGDSQEQEQQAPVKPKAGLMDELQDAIQACFSGLVGAEQRLDQTAMDIRANAEPSLHQLLEVARQLEAHFIRRRYQMVCVKPEWLVREEVQDMRAELRRREDLLLTHKHKVHHWKQMLAAAGPGAPSLPPGAHGGGGGMMVPGHMLHTPGHSMAHPVYPYHSHGGPPNLPPAPHMMGGGRPMLNMPPSGVATFMGAPRPGMAMAEGMVAGGGTPHSMVASGGTPHSMMGLQQQVLYSPHTHHHQVDGPLARLEQTTSSIGMPSQNMMYRMQ